MPLVLYVTCVVVSNKGVAVVYVINVCAERLIKFSFARYQSPHCLCLCKIHTCVVHHRCGDTPTQPQGVKALAKILVYILSVGQDALVCCLGVITAQCVCPTSQP